LSQKEEEKLKYQRERKRERKREKERELKKKAEMLRQPVDRNPASAIDFHYSRVPRKVNQLPRPETRACR